MGTDMWSVAGRVKTKPDAENSSDRPVLDFGKVAFEDLEFYSGDEVLLSRDRRLFDWLGDTFPIIKSYIADIETRQNNTKRFVEYLNREYDDLPQEQHVEGRNGIASRFMGGEIYDDAHFIGERNYTLHFVKDLVEFDYDQVVEVIMEGCEQYVGKTHRELFSRHWFEFLTWVQEQKWEFVIFGFIY